MNDVNIIKLANWIETSNTITILTGSGISVNSGIPCFRNEFGLYEQFPNAEQYLSQYFYHSHPKEFWKKYKEMFNLNNLDDFVPNRGHMFFKELEDKRKEVHILTQNIDNLHNKAGNQNVIELHGNMGSATCPKCKRTYNLKHILQQEIPRCVHRNHRGAFCNFILKPDITLFGEPVNGYQAAERAIDQADLFMVLGTSLEVHPVKNLPRFARYDENLKMAIINKETTSKDDLFDIVIHEDISNVLTRVKEHL